MSYCTVDEVASKFPSFVRNSPGDIQDGQIQEWIDDAAAEIAAALVQRGFDPDAPPQPLTTRQSNLLRSLNRKAGVAELGSALAARITLQTGEPAIVSSSGQKITTVVNDIRAGAYDSFFGIQSRLRDGNAFAGAESDQTTPEDRGENRGFGMNQDL